MNQYETTSVIIPKSKSLHENSEDIVTRVEIISDLYDENEVYHTSLEDEEEEKDLSLGDQNTETFRNLFKNQYK